MKRLIAMCVRDLDRLRNTHGALWSAAHQGLGMFMVRVSSLLLLFGIQVLLARLLGTSQYGVVMLTLSIMGVLQLVARQGFEIAAVRFVAGYSDAREWGLLRGFMRAGNLSVACGALICGIALAGVSAWLGDALPDGVLVSLRIAALTLIPFTLLQVNAAVIRGLGHAAIADIPTWIVHPILFGAAAAAAILLFGAADMAATVLWAYLGATLVTLAAQHLGFRRFLPPQLGASRPQYRWAEWLRAAPAMMLFAGSAMLLSQLSTILVGVLSGPSEAGLFSVAVRVAGVMQLITFCFIAAASPRASQMHARGEIPALQQFMTAGACVVFGASAAVLLALLILGKTVLAVFGPEFVAAYGALIVLACGQLVWAATAPAGLLLNMTGHHNASARILLFATAIHLALCTALAAAFGPVGAAAATALTTAGLNLAMAVAVRQRVGLRSWLSPVAVFHRRAPA